MKKSLDTLREQIDDVDNQLVRLLEKRLEIAQEIARVKDQLRLPVTDPNREKTMLGNLQQKIPHPILRDSLPAIFQPIMAVSKSIRALQTEKTLPFRRIGILGTGLIGGSILKTLVAKENPPIVYITKRNHTTAISSTVQVCNDIGDMVKNVDLIIIASPIETVIPLAKEIASLKNQLDHRLVIIDTASVKGMISAPFEQLTEGKLEFVPTHPMAGSEKSGFEHSRSTLLLHQPWIITAHSQNTTQTVTVVEQLIRYLGSHPITMTAKEHDEYAALVSHLVFLISMYVFAVPYETKSAALAIAGSGFETTTRLTSGNANMHQQIVAHNFPHIQKALKQFITFIQNHPCTPDTAQKLFTRYKNARDQLMSQK